jgi:hypothetical protein
MDLVIQGAKATVAPPITLPMILSGIRSAPTLLVHVFNWPERFVDPVSGFLAGAAAKVPTSAEVIGPWLVWLVVIRT